MNVNSRTIFGTFGVVVLAILFVVSSAAPVLARDADRGSRGGRSSHDAGRSSRDSRHDRGGSRLSIGFGLTNQYYSTTVRTYVPGYYQTSTEQVLAEPGHYEWQTQQVELTPARYEVRNIPAVEKTLYDKEGNEHRVVVAPARTETVYIPPTYEQRRVQVWIPDRYEIRTTQVWIPGHWVAQPSYSYSAPRTWINLGGVFRF